MPWVPDGQHFAFSGRDALSNIRLYEQLDPAAGTLALRLPLDESSGYVLHDASGHGLDFGVSTQASWRLRSASDSRPALALGGATLRIQAHDEVLAAAWRDTYVAARARATRVVVRVR